jgi:hypothetical protein
MRIGTRPAQVMEPSDDHGAAPRRRKLLGGVDHGGCPLADEEDASEELGDGEGVRIRGQAAGQRE